MALLGRTVTMFNFLMNAFMFEFLLFLEPAPEEPEVRQEELQEPQVDVVSLGFPRDKYSSQTTGKSKDYL